MFAEVLAVVRRHHDDRLVEDSPYPKRIEHATELIVQIADRSLVAPLLARGYGEEGVVFRRRGVRFMGVEVVHEGEERSATRLGLPGQKVVGDHGAVLPVGGGHDG